MKITEVKLNLPKTKEKALNQAAYLLIQGENRKQRRDNIMSNITATELKLKRLEETLKHYKEQIEELNLLDEQFDVKLKELQGAFDLTQAEILETKSALLRNQISNLKKQAGLLETGNSTLI